MPEIKIGYLADYSEYVPMVAAWQHAQFGYLTPLATLENRTEWLIRSLQKDALPLALVAIFSGKIVGSASILPTTITHKHLTPWLSSVYVSRDHRGKGIASALSLRAVAEATKLRYDRLYLFTPHNEKLYARIGWSTFERIDHNGLSLALMERQTAS